MRAAQPTEHVAGEITRWVTQPKPDTGWHVALLLLPDGTQVQITGTHHPRVGSALRAEGYYEDHPRFGRRFIVQRAEYALPQSPEGFARWMCDLKVGVGEARARELLAAFESLQALYDAILEGPKRLLQVRHMTEVVAERLHQAVTTEGAEAKHRIKLRGYGLTQNQIGRCMEVWETLEATVQHIDADPFSLAFHVHGFGFARADAVRIAMRIPHDDPARVRAGIVFALSEYADVGHTYGGKSFLARIAGEMLEVGADQVWAAIAQLDNMGLVTLAEGRRRAYLPSLLSAEDRDDHDADGRSVNNEGTQYGEDHQDDYGRRDPSWRGNGADDDYSFEV